MNQSLDGKVAILGLGIIGSRVADCLITKGAKVATWSRSFRGRQDESKSSSDVVNGAVIVSLFLKDGAAVRSVMTEVGGILRSGQIVMNHSTIDPATTHWLDAFCSEMGCRFLDAPFTGSKVAAENGTLVYYVGGEDELIEEMDPFLALSSVKRVRCGAVGHATVVKLATNLMSACAVQATAEALALAMHHGVPAEIWMKAVEANANSSALAMMKMPSILAGDFAPHFSLENMAKDGRYAAELLDGMGVEAPAIHAVLERMEKLGDAGMAELDYSALGKPYFE